MFNALVDVLPDLLDLAVRIVRAVLTVVGALAVGHHGQFPD
jgi:hypothetical protein